MVVVENVTAVRRHEAERALKELFQAVNRSDHFLIGDAEVASSRAGSAHRRLQGAAGRGIALRPDAFDGDSVFKTPFPKVKRSDFPEGRGIFVQNGRTVTVQLPLVGGSRLDARDRGRDARRPAGDGYPPHGLAGGLA